MGFFSGFLTCGGRGLGCNESQTGHKYPFGIYSKMTYILKQSKESDNRRKKDLFL